MKRGIQMDQMVLATQKWLNKTYGSVNGFNKVAENGRTGWPTIFALRRALQHEMGITALSDNFGPTTERLFKEQVEPTFNGKGTPKTNIVKILQGGFWCKGINPRVSGSEALDGMYTKFTKEAVEKFQKMAGLSPDGYLSTMLMKALLDMSAFALLGDANIRLMQQELNRKYNAYFGLLPCDGIYQRETNQALIYALQAEIGMDTETANGNYGPGTTAKTPTLVEGNSGNFVKILQWALYVNGFNKSGSFNGSFTSEVGQEVKKFREFMNLNPYTTIADMTVIKGLLSSAGNTDRSATACDMATQLNKQQVQLLKDKGYSIIGRYLTGSVGTGAKKKDKNLTTSEIQNITDAGLNIFPIYQDGGWEESYFNKENGAKDGQLAHQAAFNLGFPYGTTIYFAVDVDIQDGDIAGTVLPYIKKVQSVLASKGMYQTGIYGTRNVCQRAVDTGAVKSCFISDMSTGFSGNLGFSMPKEWAFDQFYEHEDLGFPIDKVAVSYRDSGVNQFNTTEESLVQQQAAQLLKKLKWTTLDTVNINLNTEYHIVPTFSVDVYFKVAASWENNNPKAGYSLVVSNGNVDKIKYSDPLQEELNKYSDILKLQGDQQIETVINSLAPTIGNGVIETGICARDGKIGMKFIIKKQIKETIEGHEIQTSLTLTAEIYTTPLNPAPIPVPKYKELYNDIVEGLSTINWGKVALGMGALALMGIAITVAAALAPAIAEFIEGIFTVLNLV